MATKKIKRPGSVSMVSDGKSTFLIVIIIALALAAAVVGFFVFKEKEAKVNWGASDIEAPSNIQATLTDNDEEGNFITFYTQEDQVDIVTVVSDPRCPVCKTFEEQAGKGLEERVASGQVGLRVNLLTFLDDMTESTYSKDSTATLITLVEEGDASTAWKFYNSMWENQPAERRNAKDVPTLEDLANSAGALGATDEVVEKIKNVDAAKVGGDMNEKNTEFMKEKVGQVSTPTVFLNGELQDMALAPGWVDNI